MACHRAVSWLPRLPVRAASMKKRNRRLWIYLRSLTQKSHYYGHLSWALALSRILKWATPFHTLHAGPILDIVTIRIYHRYDGMYTPSRMGVQSCQGQRESLRTWLSPEHQIQETQSPDLLHLYLPKWESTGQVTNLNRNQQEDR